MIRPKWLPNQRLKLTGCGGRLKGNGFVSFAAAAPPQLKRNPLGRCDTDGAFCPMTLSLDGQPLHPFPS